MALTIVKFKDDLWRVFGICVDKERGWTDKILKINYRKIYFYLQS